MKDSNLALNVAIAIAVLAPSYIFYNAFTKNTLDSIAAPSAKTSVEDRVRPVMTLNDIRGSEDEKPMSTDVAVVKTPEALYQGACLACHSTGVANAPKLGDKAAWEPRAAMGMDSMLQTAISGKGAMPPKGGSAYSDDELRSVIEYMLAEAGL